MKRVAVVDLDPVGPCQVDQRGVERQAGHDGGELAHAGREREADGAPGRRSHPRLVDDLPAGHAGGVEAEVLEQAQRSRRQTVAAALVPREAGLVDEHDVAPRPRQLDGRRDATRPAADDDDVGLDHGRSG